MKKRTAGALVGAAVGGGFVLFVQVVVPAICRLPSTSAGYHWRTAGLPLYRDRDLVSVVAVSPNGSVFAGTYRSGVLRSVDGGRHWGRGFSGMRECSVDAVVVDAKGPSLPAPAEGSTAHSTTEEAGPWQTEDYPSPPSRALPQTRGDGSTRELTMAAYTPRLMAPGAGYASRRASRTPGCPRARSASPAEV